MSEMHDIPNRLGLPPAMTSMPSSDMASVCSFLFLPVSYEWGTRSPEVLAALVRAKMVSKSFNVNGAPVGKLALVLGVFASVGGFIFG